MLEEETVLQLLRVRNACGVFYTIGRYIGIGGDYNWYESATGRVLKLGNENTLKDNEVEARIPVSEICTMIKEPNS